MKMKIESICQDFFKLMKIDIKNLTIKCEDEERWIYFVHLETDDSKLLIWTHWQTLEYIKHLLSRMIERQLWDSVVLHLEINDYLKSKDEKMFRYIDSKIDFVIKSQKNIVLPEYSSYERKKIHNYISEKKLTNIKSYSEWEWKERAMHLTYISKVNNSNIDIDWIDI